MSTLARWFFSVVLCFSAGCSFISVDPEDTNAVHVVKQGDTLSEIAKRYGTTANAIIQANELSNKHTLRIGQPLIIPQSDYRASLRPSQNNLQDRKQPVEGRLKLKNGRAYFNSLYWPVQALRMGSGFGYRRDKFHDGLDLMAAEGTEIVAAHNGEVVYSGNGLSGYGNLIVVRSGSLLTIYAHNRKNSVSQGDYVEKGEIIGEVGQTGRASGPHLHFEVRLQAEDGKYYAVDPLRFLQH